MNNTIQYRDLRYPVVLYSPGSEFVFYNYIRPKSWSKQSHFLAREDDVDALRLDMTGNNLRSHIYIFVKRALRYS